MKIFFVVAFSFIFWNISKAQIPSDSVYVQKSFWGYKYFQKNTRLNFNQLPYIMEDDQEAYRLIKKAKGTNLSSTIIGGIGGFMIGWQLGIALVGGEANWTMAAIGGGLVVVSIPISSKSNKQSLEAVKIYNAGLSAYGYRPRMLVGAMSHGLGVKLEF